MTLLLPFLPLYVEQLGVTGHAAISEWSGVAYGAAFFTAALTAPLWGRLGDRYGRKLMLIRASLGMAVAMTLLGMAQSVWQLVALRLLAGLLGGYASGSTILVATQTPKERTGWALGMLSSGIMAGNLVGQLIGGTLPPLIGIRGTFILAGGAIFIAFLATVVLLKEVPGTGPRKTAAVTSPVVSPWRNLPVMAMLITGTLLMLANMSIEPIITLYVAQLVSGQQVTFVAGLVMAAAALGSILSASRLGRLADKIGHWRVIYRLFAGGGSTADSAGVRHRRRAIGGAAFLYGAGIGRAVALYRQRDSPYRTARAGLQRAGPVDIRAICRPGNGTANGRRDRRPFWYASGFSRHLPVAGGRRGL